MVNSKLTSGVLFIISFMVIICTPVFANSNPNSQEKGDSAVFSIPLSVYKITKIKSKKRLYIIYAEKGNKIYKIISLKEKMKCIGNQRIHRNREYKLSLKSYFLRYDRNGIRLPHPGETGAGGLAYGRVLINVEQTGNYVWDLFRATNLKGLCLIKEED